MFYYSYSDSLRRHGQPDALERQELAGGRPRSQRVLLHSFPAARVPHRHQERFASKYRMLFYSGSDFPQFNMESWEYRVVHLVTLLG